MQIPLSPECALFFVFCFFISVCMQWETQPGKNNVVLYYNGCTDTLVCIVHGYVARAALALLVACIIKLIKIIRMMSLLRLRVISYSCTVLYAYMQ